MRLFPILCFLTLHTTCSDNAQEAPANTFSADTVKQYTSTKTYLATTPPLDWKDSIVKQYVYTTSNPLVGTIKNDTVYGWSYIFDSNTRGGKEYITVQIGQSFEDHFATSAWLYIDSLTKKCYELDIVNDSIVEWNRNK